MEVIKLAQQLFRAAKRMAHAETVLAGRRSSTLEGDSYHIQVFSDDGKRFDVTIKEAADAPR